jgi:hypothetical protein
MDVNCRAHTARVQKLIYWILLIIKLLEKSGLNDGGAAVLLIIGFE